GEERELTCSSDPVQILLSVSLFTMQQAEPFTNGQDHGAIEPVYVFPLARKCYLTYPVFLGEGTMRPAKLAFDQRPVFVAWPRSDLLAWCKGQSRSTCLGIA